MAWPRILSGLIYPPRQVGSFQSPSGREIDAWVEAAGTEHFERIDDAFVTRALGLGVSGGMVLDLDSRLGLVSMKLLWREEGLLCMGVYGSLDVAERVRHTAGEWGLGKRMFFQVGDPMDLRFKAEYFDIVVSDGALHTTGNPRRLLGEIARVAKPAGAILLAQTARPARLRMRKVLSEGTADCPDTLRSWQDARVRSGYTRAELADLVRAAGLERTRVVEDRGFLFIERPGANDPSSWVSEREKYY